MKTMIFKVWVARGQFPIRVCELWAKRLKTPFSKQNRCAKTAHSLHFQWNEQILSLTGFTHPRYVPPYAHSFYQHF